jgi:hypothetical protein
MTQKNLLKNQVLEELLREKSNNYQINKQQRDFWIINSPNFLEELKLTEKIKNSNFYKNNRDNVNYFSCLVSLDKKYIQWIELRLGYFENLKTLKTQNIGSNYISDGIYGEIEYWLSFLKIGVIIIFIILGLFSGLWNAFTILNKESSTKSMEDAAKGRDANIQLARNAQGTLYIQKITFNERVMK